MYSYGSRHKVDYESSKSIEDGCGYLMMLSWGFTPDNYEAAMKFLERELEKSTELNVMMSSNEYEGDITSVVFQPNQKIYRWDRETNQPYYVFMSRETIRKMLMKFLRVTGLNSPFPSHHLLLDSGSSQKLQRLFYATSRLLAALILLALDTHTLTLL
jgi:hypothetical protein